MDHSLLWSKLHINCEFFQLFFVTSVNNFTNLAHSEAVSSRLVHAAVESYVNIAPSVWSPDSGA